MIMNDIFKRLNEIESAATSILEQANAQKKEMAEANDKRIALFETETARKTADMIAQQKAELNKQIAIELEEQQANIKKDLKKLKEDYEQNHGQLAKQILASMVKE